MHKFDVICEHRILLVKDERQAIVKADYRRPWRA